VEKMKAYAQQACDIYTQWANGDVWYYTIEVYKLRRYRGAVLDEPSDYRHNEPVLEDSLSGIYGLQEAIDAATKMVRELLVDANKIPKEAA
jgi:hypothetical protein